MFEIATNTLAISASVQLHHIPIAWLTIQVLLYCWGTAYLTVTCSWSTTIVLAGDEGCFVVVVPFGLLTVRTSSWQVAWIEGSTVQRRATQSPAPSVHQLGC